MKKVDSIIIRSFELEDFIKTLLANDYVLELENATLEENFDGINVDRISIKIYK